MQPENRFNPFKHMDILHEILYWTIGSESIRQLFCVNTSFNEVMTSFYTIVKAEDPPCVVCHKKDENMGVLWGRSSYEIYRKVTVLCEPECKWSCAVCRETNNLDGFTAYSQTTVKPKIRTYVMTMRFSIVYHRNGVCERCLYTAKKKVCVKCKVVFMAHNGYVGKHTMCSRCHGNYAMVPHQNFSDIKDTIVLPSGFPHIINKIKLQ